MRLIQHGEFDTFYQPIFDLGTQRILGHEILHRPRDYAADRFYSDLHRCGCQTTVDFLFLSQVLRKACLSSELVFVNVFPGTVPHLGHFDFDRSQVVFEVSERVTHTPYDICWRTVCESGYQMAIDDLGIGYSGLHRLLEVKPKYVKVDRQLIAGIDTSHDKQDLLRMIVGYAHGRFDVIAEGLETDAELRVVQELGVTYGQGYFLGRPVQRA